MAKKQTKKQKISKNTKKADEKATKKIEDSEEKEHAKISLDDFMRIVESDNKDEDAEEMTFDEVIEFLDDEAAFEREKVERYEQAREVIANTPIVDVKKLAAGVLLLSLTVGGLALGNMVSDAAEKNIDHQLLAAEYIDFDTGVTESTFAIDELMALRVPYVIGEHGTIEAFSNCSIDYDNNMIVFGDKTQSAYVKITPQSGYEPIISSSLPVSISQGISEFEPSDEYGVISIKFVLPSELDAAIASTRTEAGSGIGGQYISTSSSGSPASAPSPSYSSEEVSAPSSPSYEEPSYDGGGSDEYTYYEEPGYYYEETTTYYTSGGESSGSSRAGGSSAPSSDGGSSSVSGHNMTSSELECARDIFNAYNDYRASCGLSRVAWSDNCANMAYSCSTQCAARGVLTHRLGIPADAQDHYSDILQYASWRMSGSDAVQKWIDSDGHRRQMRCASTGNAGVGVYQDGSGRWYFTIVYDFSSTNVG